MFYLYDLTAFGSELVAIRKNLGLTQKVVCDLTGYHPDALRRLENGFTIPKYETLELLSTIYRMDLLEVLRNFRQEENLTRFYDELDQILLNNQFDALDQLQLTFDDLILKHKEQLINQQEIVEFRLFMDILQLCKPTTPEKEQVQMHQLIQQVEKFYQVTIGKTKYSQLNNVFNTHIQLRILLNLAIAFVKIKGYHQAIELFNYLIDKTKKTLKLNEKNVLMLIKAYASLSFCYNIIDKDLETIEIADAGIQLSVEKNTFLFLPSLYFRKGIALLKLGKEGYRIYLEYSIHLLDMTLQVELAKIYRESLNHYYHIQIE